MSTDILEVFRQYSFLSSVLAGFALTGAIELVALGKKGRVASSAIAMFLLSAVVSVAATFVFVFVMTGLIGPPGFPRPSEAWVAHFVGGIGVLPLGGLILFLAGIALVGWLRSKALGMLTTVSSALALVLIIYILRSMALQ
jgi:hypothetical protein